MDKAMAYGRRRSRTIHGTISNKYIIVVVIQAQLQSSLYFGK
jgi:hypothetical protein